MEKLEKVRHRRRFLKTAIATALGTFSPVEKLFSRSYSQDKLSVWSCGGLAEAFMPANKQFKAHTGIDVTYTGAFAAALGKSLLGSATTDVFAGRVLGLAQKLREANKMAFFKPLCFTQYVMVTPKGNPAAIKTLKDMARPGVRVVISPQASPPGGQAVTGILKNAGILAEISPNIVVEGSCVQREMETIITGKGDVVIVELRLARIPRFSGKVEVIPIEEDYFPAPPLTFTIGTMTAAKDPNLANDYVDFITSPQGQAFFEKQGFIPAASEKGKQLTERLGVMDA